MAIAFLRLPAVLARTGLSRSTIYLRIAQGAFPKAREAWRGARRGLDRGGDRGASGPADRACPPRRMRGAPWT